MLNWKTIKSKYPNGYSALQDWIAKIFSPDSVTLEMVDENDNPSDHHLKIKIKHIIPAPSASKNKKDRKPKVRFAGEDNGLSEVEFAYAERIRVVFLQLRELFDFFDDKGIDIGTIPAFREMFGTTNKKRMYNVVVFFEEIKIYPSNMEMFGDEYDDRRDAEIFAFEKGFQILEQQTQFSK